ncbi:MAG TPA: cytochrome P450 [Acidimicrobiales bacterium]|nr:cytochrome P450 [Acidimicrobiales bacterium]
MELDEIDLSDINLWGGDYQARHDAFTTLRRERPIPFMKEPEVAGALITGPGYYSLTKHAHVLEASKQPHLFCSGRGTNIPDMPPPFLDFFGSMINMDDPRHARMRRIVSRGFTPKQLNDAMESVERIAAEIVDDIIDKGECDFVTDVAALLPLRIILDMMGIPRSMEQFVFDRTNVILGATDPEYVPPGPDGELDPMVVTTALLTAGQELANLVIELGEARQKDPLDDLTTALVTAEVDGETLTPTELGSFFILLVVAGNETTRNAIAHGLHALTEHPDQKERWLADVDGLMPTAIEELVRWATPVIHFRRTVTQDGVRIGDQEFSEGDKVVLWYASANRDEDVFDDPFRFDVGRTPNDHVGFGGPGPHFCLGAHLARREMSVMFRELFRRVPDIRSVGEPDRLRSNFINGIKHLRAEFTPSGRS